MSVNDKARRCNSSQGLSFFWHTFRDKVKDQLHVSFFEDYSSRTAPTYEWIVTARNKAETQVAEYLERKLLNPKLGACILIGRKAAKANGLHRMLKGMRLIHDGRVGQEFDQDGRKYLVPYSFCVFQDMPSCHVALATSFPGTSAGLLPVFPVICPHVQAKALVDTGATHSFVSRTFVDILGLPITGRTQEIKMADGNTMTSAGTAKLRVTLNANLHEFRKFIVCEDLLDGVDLILGQDFLSQYQALISYKDKLARCMLYHNKRYHVMGRTYGQKDKDGQYKGQFRKHNTRRFKVLSPLVSLEVQEPMPTAVNATPYRRIHLANVAGQDPELDYQDDIASNLEFEDDESGATQLNQDFIGALDKLQLDPDIRTLLLAYKDIFPTSLPGLPPHRSVFHTIPLEPGHRPPCRPCYRLAPPEMQECKTQVETLLSQGLIRPSSSPYGSPVLFVRKKDKSYRMVIDFRALNKITIQDKYPIPRIDDLLDRLQNAQIFSSLDLLSGYHQVRLQESDIAKTAFRTPMGLYEFLVLPFGLTNAPATFQRLMATIFHDFVREGFLVIYLDDLLVYSRTKDEHVEHLRRVFERLRQSQLYAKFTKCAFFRTELAYLGHVVGKDGLRVDPGKVKVVDEWPAPTNVHEVRQFLGLANYFRKFIQNYSTIAAPLTALTSSKTQWTWGDQEQEAFLNVKKALTRSPVLALPDQTKGFKIICDASNYGVGAVLTQDGRAVAFFSKKLNDAERNYHTTEKELAAVVYALKEWRCYVLGQEVTVVTDHRANSFLQSQPFLSPRRARWSEFLQDFSIIWNWEPGRTNVADPISRCPNLLVMTRGQLQETASSRRGHQEDTCTGREVGQGTTGLGGTAGPTKPTTELYGCADWLPLLKTAYLVDPWLHKKQNRRKVTFRDGLWYKDTRIYVPMHHLHEDGTERNLRRDVLEALHGPVYIGHPGRTKTLQLVAKTWWWPGLYEHVKDFVAFCDSCQKVKASTQLPAGLLQPLEIPRRKWQSISMDLITGLPKTKTGFDAIWVVVDRLSKCAHFAATTTNADAEDIAELLRTRVYMNHGSPLEIVSDRDPRFTSKFSQALFRLTGCRSALSTAFHPQSDGQTERVNRILEDYLRHYVGPRQTDWDKHLPEAEFAYNNSWQASINTTPFRLTYGQDPIIPFQNIMDTDIPSADVFARRMRQDLDRARTFLVAAQDRQKFYADTQRRQLTLDVGQQVLLSTRNLRLHGTAKLLPRFIGPFAVTQCVSPVAYRLNLPSHYKIHNVFHLSLLKPYRDSGKVQPPPPELIDGELMYEVEAIIAHRDGRGRKGREYLVRWTGYGPIHDSWEPEGSLASAPDALRQYLDHHEEQPLHRAKRRTKRKRT
jgi:hypothetical protein